jgi:hypothetical protein
MLGQLDVEVEDRRRDQRQEPEPEEDRLAGQKVEDHPARQTGRHQPEAVAHPPLGPAADRHAAPHRRHAFAQRRTEVVQRQQIAPQQPPVANGRRLIGEALVPDIDVMTGMRHPPFLEIGQQGHGQCRADHPVHPAAAEGDEMHAFMGKFQIAGIDRADQHRPQDLQRQDAGAEGEPGPGTPDRPLFGHAPQEIAVPDLHEAGICQQSRTFGSKPPLGGGGVCLHRRPPAGGVIRYGVKSQSDAHDCPSST